MYKLSMGGSFPGGGGFSGADFSGVVAGLFLQPLLHYCCSCDVTTLKIARKPVKKLQRENPAGCAGEGKQRERN